jgi:hypothetical protein
VAPIKKTPLEWARYLINFVDFLRKIWSYMIQKGMAWVVQGTPNICRKSEHDIKVFRWMTRRDFISKDYVAFFMEHNMEKTLQIIKPTACAN